MALVARAHGVNAKNQATFIGFEVGASALSTLTQYELTKHGHRKPAWIGRAIETGVLAHTVTEQLPAGYDPGGDGVEASDCGGAGRKKRRAMIRSGASLQDRTTWSPTLFSCVWAVLVHLGWILGHGSMLISHW